MQFLVVIKSTLSRINHIKAKHFELLFNNTIKNKLTHNDIMRSSRLKALPCLMGVRVKVRVKGEASEKRWSCRKWSQAGEF